MKRHQQGLAHILRVKYQNNNSIKQWMVFNEASILLKIQTSLRQHSPLSIKKLPYVKWHLKINCLTLQKNKAHSRDFRKIAFSSWLNKLKRRGILLMQQLSNNMKKNAIPKWWMNLMIGRRSWYPLHCKMAQGTTWWMKILKNPPQVSPKLSISKDRIKDSKTWEVPIVLLGW